MIQAFKLFLIVLAAYTLTAGGHLYSPDEEVMFRTVRSMARLEGTAIEPMMGFATRAPRPARLDGREYAQYGIGQPLLAVPFYWAGSVLGHLGSDAAWQKIYGARQLGMRMAFEPTAAELAPRFALSWFNILLAAAMAGLVYLLCMELTADTNAATWATLLYALGSMAWAHSRPFFSEGCAAFFIVLAWLAVLRSLRVKTDRNFFTLLAGAGAAAGFAFLVRNDSALAYPGLGLVILISAADRARQRGLAPLKAWVAFALPALVMGCVQLLLNKLRFGGFLASGYSDQAEGIAFTTPILAGLYGLLFSAGKGMFFFSPALVLSFWGWRPLAKFTRQRSKWIVWGLALAILIPLAIHAKWQNWPGGWCWGPRHIFLIHVFFAPAIAAFLRLCWGPVIRIFALVLLIIGIGVQLMGSSVDFIDFHQRFFRSPGDPTTFFVQYDPSDMAYWSHYYQLSYKGPRDKAPRAIPLFPPSPIQHSIYIPQKSVWTGYPIMIREGAIDLFWLRLLSPAPAPTPGVRRP